MCDQKILIFCEVYYGSVIRHFEICDTLIDDGIFSSFDIVSLVGELNDAFDIDITPVDIVPENFNSAEAMWEMIQRLQD